AGAIHPGHRRPRTPTAGCSSSSRSNGQPRAAPARSPARWAGSGSAGTGAASSARWSFRWMPIAWYSSGKHSCIMAGKHYFPFVSCSPHGTQIGCGCHPLPQESYLGVERRSEGSTMTQPVTVRSATEEDVEPWLALAKSVEPLFGPMPDIAGPIQRSISRGTALVAEDRDGRLAGAALLSRDDQPHVIHWLAVRPDARRQGIGSALMKAII